MIPTTPISSASLAPAPLAQLSAEQQGRLTEVLDRYLSALEQGAPLSQAALLTEHPDLAETLTTYFRSLEELHDLAAGFGGMPAPSQRPESSTSDEGKRLGDFELIREIGRGGMGVVYEARQISLGRRVALKLLPFAAVLDSRQIARFKHEAQAAAHLHHQNIVPVFAIGVERGVHYYAMQYIDGQPLDRAIAEQRAARGRGSSQRSEQIRSAMRLGIQAAEALHAAHDFGVVHRDIKPSNLLLEPSGKLWIADFGLARFQRDAALTRTGDLVGTLRYMSPEQAAGRLGMVDHRTDIYSLGATLYELVCLRPAFPDKDSPALLRQIERDEPPTPRQVRRDIPAELETVILKAMSKDRGERYATAQELADDLRNVLDGKPTLARPASLLDRMGRWSRRHRRMVGLGIAATFLAIVGLAASTLLIAREKARAENNVVRADRYFREARQVLDRFGVRLAERLADVPGAEALRQELLQETRAYYESFVSEAQSDPKLRAEMALTYGKIATLLDEFGTPDEAASAHRKAWDVFAELARAEPNNQEYQKRLAQCGNNLALALARAGHSDEARQQWAETIARQQRLVASAPANEELRADLATSLTNLGLLESETGQRDSAQAAFHSATSLLQELLAAQPDDPDRQRKLAGAYNNLAASFLSDRPQQAAELHEQALVLQRQAAETRPDDLPAHRDVALTLNNLGAAYSRTGEAAAARSSYEQAIQLQEELARLAPAHRAYLRDLAVSHNNLGLILSRQGEQVAAATAFGRALAIEQALVREQPGDFALQSSLGGVLHNLGMLHEEAGKLAEAAASFSSAIEHQRTATVGAPQVARYRQFLDQHYTSYSRVLRQLGREAEAQTVTQESATFAHLSRAKP